MIKYAVFPALALLLLSPQAFAQSPPEQGEWLVKDATAHIRIVECAQKLWGVISWEKTAGTDEHNPDSARRALPTLGLPILLGLKEDGAGKWQGQIYNAENGKLYDGGIHLKSGSILHVEGCVLYGTLCGGEDWTRLDVPLGATEPAAECRAITRRFHGDEAPQK